MGQDEAVGIKNEITSHSHYGSCLNGSRYNTFNKNRDELNEALEYRDRLYKLKEEIIKENNDLKIKEKNYNQNNELKKKEYELLKQEHKQIEELKSALEMKMREIEELKEIINNNNKKIKMLKEKSKGPKFTNASYGMIFSKKINE